MDGKTFRNEVTAILVELLETITKKNQDYGSPDDAFRNFRNAEALGLSLEYGIALRLSDKFARFQNLMQREAEVDDETIDDTLMDLAGYAVILLAYRNGGNSVPPATMPLITPPPVAQPIVCLCDSLSQCHSGIEYCPYWRGTKPRKQLTVAD